MSRTPRFTTVMPDVVGTSTVTVSTFDIVGPDDAKALFSTKPASTSAWVTVYVDVQVSVAPGASPPGGSTGQDTVVRSSVTATAWSVTLPVLVTTYL